MKIRSAYIETISPEAVGARSTLSRDTALSFTAFEALPVAVAVIDPHGLIRFANAAFTSLTGYPSHLIAGQSAARLSFEPAQDRISDILRQAAASGKPWRSECLWRTMTSEALAVDQTVTPVLAASGDLSYAVITVQKPDARAADETEAKRMDSLAEEAQRDFDRFFNLIPDLACIVSTDGYFKKVNPAWQSTLGYTLDEVLRTPMLDFIHPDDLERTLNEIAKQSRVYRTKHFVNRYRCKDGSYRLFDWTTTFNRDESTRFGIARDITEQRLWEESLRESEERFRIMADSCPTIIWVTDADGKICLTNRVCREFFGASFEQADADAQLRAIVHPDDYDVYVEKFLAAVTGRAPFRAEARVRRADGDWRWIASYGEPRISLSGDFLGHVGISPDITDRKQTEAALRSAKEAAEIANRLKGEFLANMSHEIRTPMNGVIGLTDLALETELTTEQREYLNGVKLSAESLLRILNDILDFSKIEAGKLEFEAIDFDLRQTVISVLKILSTKAAAKNLELACEFDPQVPQRVVGDPVRLEQILMNLGGNAIKFTEAGEVVVNVSRIPAADASVQLQFSVRDTGIGIPSDKQQHVFGAFAQADTSSTRRFGGTGLGLSISRQLIAMMSGRIWLESEQGKGSTFHFTVRLGEAALAPERPRAQLSLGENSFLIVDDNAASRRILERILAGWGLSPVSARSGHEALAVLSQAANARNPFSVVLLDAQMPGMDGLTVATQIRDDPQLAAIHIVLLTSGIHRGISERCRGLGISTCLVKPATEAELFSALGKISHSISSLAIAVGTSPARVAPIENERPLHVLVVEDNPVNRLVATRLLEKRHHVVRTAANGGEALEVIAKETFDCVLMDVQMPVLDGFETTASIRRQERTSGRHLPIIAMTAHAMAGDVERCHAAGMDGYVSKPVKAADLFAVIEGVLQVSRPDGASPVSSAPEHTGANNF